MPSPVFRLILPNAQQSSRALRSNYIFHQLAANPHATHYSCLPLTSRNPPLQENTIWNAKEISLPTSSPVQASIVILPRPLLRQTSTPGSSPAMSRKFDYDPDLVLQTPAARRILWQTPGRLRHFTFSRWSKHRHPSRPCRIGIYNLSWRIVSFPVIHHTCPFLDMPAFSCRIYASAPSGGTTGATALASTTLLRSSGLSLIVETTLKDGDGEAGTSPGDLVEYSMTIKNTGTVTLTALSVVDSLLSVADDK